MRILLVNKFYFERGGAERCFFDQERWLRAQGHEVRVFAQRGTNTLATTDLEYFVPEVAFDRGASAALRGLGRWFWSPDVAERLGKLLGTFRPELAILHNVYHHLGPAVATTLHAHRVPSVMVLHDHKVACPAYSAFREGAPCSACTGQRFHQAALQGCGGSRLKGTLLAAESYFQWRVLKSYQTISRFVVPSFYLRDQLLRMGFPFSIDVIRNAVDTSPPADEAGRVAVGFAGRLTTEKGVAVLVAAAARLPKIFFRVAGDGPAWPTLSAAARALPNLTCLGRLREGELASEMRRWRVAAVPSLSPENFPYAALDAMNRGVPLVASHVGGLPELLDGRGLLVPPGDDLGLANAIQTLWTDAPLRARLSRASLTYVENECRPSRHLEQLLQPRVNS